jgi:hypothetical protein
MMPTKSRLKNSKQVVATDMSLHLPSHQRLKNLRQTNKKTDWSVIRKLGRATDLRNEQHHRSLSLPRKFGAHKNMVKDMGQHNFMNDKGISSTPAASDLINITASQISVSLTVANENYLCGKPQLTSSIQQRSRQKIIVQTLNSHLNLGSLRGIDNPQSTQVLVKLPLRKTRVHIYSHKTTILSFNQAISISAFLNI